MSLLYGEFIKPTALFNAELKSGGNTAPFDTDYPLPLFGI